MPKALGSIPKTKKEAETEEGGGGERKGREKRREEKSGERDSCEEYLPISVTFQKREPVETPGLARFQANRGDHSCHLTALRGAKRTEGEE